MSIKCEEGNPDKIIKDRFLGIYREAKSNIDNIYNATINENRTNGKLINAVIVINYEKPLKLEEVEIDE